MSFAGKLKTTLSLLLTSIKRFPQTILFCIGTAVMLIILSHGNFRGNNLNINVRLTLSFALMIPLFSGINLFFERKPAAHAAKYLINIAALVLGYLVFAFLLRDIYVDRTPYISSFQPIMSYLLLFSFFTLVYFYVPYNSKKEDYENYIIKLFTNFIISIIYTFVLTMGIFAILFTIDKLFGLHIDSKIYGDIWIALFVVLAPTYFLSNNPTQDDTLTEYYPSFIKVLLSYIILPLITTYSLILYVYFAKIVVTRNWPIGLVSNLVLWSVLAGIVSIFFITPITKDNKWLSNFKKWYPILSIPLILMMFISLGIRIKAYGITEPRYAVLVTGIWELGIMLYYIISKTHKNIVLPISLSLIVLVSGFTPISAFNVSKVSQNARIQAIFSKYNMIQNNMIVKATNIPNSTERREILSILKYFETYHKYADIDYMVINFDISLAKNVLGFELYDNNQYDNKNNRYYNISLNESVSLNLTGYKYLLSGSAYYYPTKTDIPKELIRQEFNSNTKILKIYKGNTEIFTKDLSSDISKIVDKYISNLNLRSDNTVIDNQEDLSLKDSNDKIDLKIVFRNISGNKNMATGELKDSNASMYILYNLK